ncbi:hypothetical protein DFH08DRAFT_936583 [Mycena albidolilacea]|uniref:Uncharacterized protein n=1 Tax=Mycena albidolilacea TaxID=1033008 RepID=A0AAD7ER96_9AGAR|nr:hypothetical protein DFH08DRAFT_936583 [Mycena albidolilacea]
MCDTSHILQSSALLWTLSLIPGSILPYLALGVTSTYIIIYALGHNFPSARLDRVNVERCDHRRGRTFDSRKDKVHTGLFSPGQGQNSIPTTVVSRVARRGYTRLAHINAPRIWRSRTGLNAVNGMSSRNKLAVSKLRSRLLETRNIPGWKDYLRDMITILHGLAMLECEVRDIQAFLLVLLEVSHQRKLAQDIHKNQEIFNGTVHPQYSSTCLTMKFNLIRMKLLLNYTSNAFYMLSCTLILC